MTRAVEKPEGANDLPVAYLAHHIHQRCRLVVPAMKGDADYLDRVVRRLRATSCISSVRANTFAGSLAIEYTGRFEQVSWIGRRHVSSS